MTRWIILASLFLAAVGWAASVAPADEPPLKSSSELAWVQVSPDRRGFSFDGDGGPFVPWGFNYDHDERGRLIEDYWLDEWPKVEEDFDEMKQLGANV
ncbi:MAG: hypothetical protein WEH44_00845, partial [Pirellulaceae bacterium]